MANGNGVAQLTALPTPPRVAPPLRKLPNLAVAVAGALCLALGIVVLLGWRLDVHWIVQVRPGWKPMSPNAACGFQLIGVALLATSLRLQWLAVFTAAAAGLFGAAVIFQNRFGIDLPIDDLLMAVPPYGPWHPGRMGSMLAVGFVLAGSAVVNAHAGGRASRRSWMAGMAGGAVGAMGGVASVGYASGLRTAYTRAQWDAISVQAAVGCTLMAAGLLALAWREERGPYRHTPTWVPASSGVVLIIATLLLREVLPHWSPALGVATSALVAVAAYLAQSARHKARELLAVNQLLELEITRRKRIQDQQAHLTAILEATPDFISTISPNGRAEFFNAAARRMRGVPDGTAMLGFIAEHHPAWAAELLLREALPTAAAAGFWTGETALLTATGAEIPVSQVVLAHRSAGGEIQYYSTICRDISEQKRAESELRRLNRALKALGECTQTLIHATDETALLQDVCQVVVRAGGFVFAWVGFAEQDEAKTVRPVAHAGYEDGYLKTVNASWADVPRGRGPTGIAIRTGRPAVVRFAESDPTFAPWREEALRRGYRCSIGLPLKAGDRVLGMLAVYAGEPDAFDAEEVELMSELANELAYGVVALRTRGERERAAAELRRSDAALREAAEQIRIAATAAGLGFWHWNLVTSEIVWTARSKALFGLPADQAMSYAIFRSVVHPDDRAAMDLCAAQAVRDHSEYHDEYRALWPDGSVHWIAVSGRAVYDDDGKPLHMHGVMADITDHKRADAELTARARQQQAAAELGQLALSGTDLDRLMKEAVVILARTLDVEYCGVLELLPDGLAFLLRAGAGWSPSLLNRATVPAGKASQAGYALAVRAPVAVEDLRTETRFASPAEFFEHPVASGVTAVIPTPDRPFGVLAAHTIQRRAFSGDEVRFLDSVANVLGLAIARKKVEQELAVFAEELQRSNRDLQDFASIASHDLQEPLRKIMAFGERLRGCAGQLDDTGRDFLTRMETAAARMSELIERLLQFSRVSTKAQPFEAVDLNLVMFGVLSDLEARIAATGARVEFGSLPVVQADRLQMRELLQNLIANALKFHRAGEAPHVVVEGELRDGTCEVRVRDNGIGFDARYAERIFRPFQRLHGRSEYDGSGMGLAICRKIVYRHGGTITGRGTPGRGSEFVFTLPAVRPLEGSTWPTNKGLSSWSPRTMTTTTS